VMLGGSALWEPGELPQGERFARVEISSPEYADRLRLWDEAASGDARPEWLRDIAGKYRMTGGQIRDAAATGRQIAAFQGQNDGRPTLDDLQEACRMHSNRKLETLARRIVPRYRWKDIVLPNDRMEQLQEIRATLQYRPVVFGEWGF